jgi:hypothetical protein
MKDIHCKRALASFKASVWGEWAYLLVEDILARNVRGDVTSDRVSNSIRTVRVELSSRISLGLDISMGTWSKERDVRCSWMYHPRNRGSGHSKES